MNAISPTLGPKYHFDLAQGSTEWMEARLGVLTASEIKYIVTPSTLKPASNDKERAHLWELLGQRINRRVEEGYQSDAMLRGHADEAFARYLYAEHYAPVEMCGFVTNDRWGFKLGYSPDGLVGDDGLIECKSRMAKYQVETLVEYFPKGEIPDEFRLQVQAALLITERKWCDFISYSNGMPMVTIRVEPDPVCQAAILTAAEAFEKRLNEKLLALAEATSLPGARLIPTEYTPPNQGDISA